MFADSLCDTPWADRSRRGWSTLVSFAIQTAAVATVLLLPLLYTSALPQIQQMAALVAPAPPPAPPAPAVRTQTTPVSNVAPDGGLLTPRSIPHSIQQISETVAPAPPDVGQFVTGGTGEYARGNAVLDSIGRGINLAVAPPPPPPVERPIRVSRMMQGNLIHQVQPEYPAIAKMAHVQGSVVLRAIISKDGRIENLQLVSGPALLVQSAIAAVSQWRYRPYLLNNEPVEVETQVTVNFILSGR